MVQAQDMLSFDPLLPISYETRCYHTYQDCSIYLLCYLILMTYTPGSSLLCHPCPVILFAIDSKTALMLHSCQDPTITFYTNHTRSLSEAGGINSHWLCHVRALRPVPVLLVASLAGAPRSEKSDLDSVCPHQGSLGSRHSSRGAGRKPLLG